MPSTGMPSSSSSRSSAGAPSSYTEAGPPERITPLGRRRLISPRPTWCGSSSENTPHSRTRRAISCEYCPPKSRTTTSSVAVSRSPSGRARTAPGTSSLRNPAPGPSCKPDPSEPDSVARPVSVGGDTDRRGFCAHADALLALQMLALGLERRRHRELRAVELGDIAVAAGRHRGLQRAHQVERAVVLAGRALDDLLERTV